MTAAVYESGYVHLDLSGATELFISITPGFEYGPGIQRDGLTAPRMTSPQGVKYVCSQRGLPPSTHAKSSTTDPNQQRTGTWSIYSHLDAFKRNHPGWRVIAVQSHGDLTMNPWHIAYLNENTANPALSGILCGLFTDGDPQEPVESRTYHCLVKWNELARRHNGGRKYAFLSLKIRANGNKERLFLCDRNYDRSWLDNWRKDKKKEINDDITGLVAFAMAGKEIVKRGYPVPLQRAVDKFDDIRHILSLPKVDIQQGQCAKVQSSTQQGCTLYLGEYQLYRNRNERRAALCGPVIIDTSIEDKDIPITVCLDPSAVAAQIKSSMRLHEDVGQPAHPGHFRNFPDGEDQLEIFFEHAVYPFGAIGLAADEHGVSSMKGYVTSGLSGRLGSTLEGVIHTMYHFLRCDDAIILDEGNDCCLLVNPWCEDHFQYANDEFLDKVLALTHDLVEREKTAPSHTDLATLDGNEELGSLMQEYKRKWSGKHPPDYDDICIAKPARPQIRSMIIYAVPE